MRHHLTIACIFLMGFFISNPLSAGMRMSLYAVTASKIQEMQKDPKKLEKFLEEADGPDCLDIDKAWHGIHFLITGTDWKPQPGLGQIILGGKQIGEDNGDGAPHFFTAEEVQDMASALKKLTPELISKRYNPSAMDKLGIYPEIWVRDGKDGLEYLIEYYKKLTSFYLQASKKNQAIIFVIG